LSMREVWDAAVRHYQAALEAGHSNPMIHNNLAWAAYQQDSLDLAWKHARTARDKAGKAAPILHTFGTIALARDATSESLDALAKAHEHAPENATFALDYARALKRTGDHDRARTVAERVLNSSNAEAASRSAARSLLESLGG